MLICFFYYFTGICWYHTGFGNHVICFQYVQSSIGKIWYIVSHWQLSGDCHFLQVMFCSPLNDASFAASSVFRWCTIHGTCKMVALLVLVASIPLPCDLFLQTGYSLSSAGDIVFLCVSCDYCVDFQCHSSVCVEHPWHIFILSSATPLCGKLPCFLGYGMLIEQNPSKRDLLSGFSPLEAWWTNETKKFNLKIRRVPFNITKVFGGT